MFIEQVLSPARSRRPPPLHSTPDCFLSVKLNPNHPPASASPDTNTHEIDPHHTPSHGASSMLATSSACHQPGPDQSAGPEPPFRLTAQSGSTLPAGVAVHKYTAIPTTRTLAPADADVSYNAGSTSGRLAGRRSTGLPRRAATPARRAAAISACGHRWSVQQRNDVSYLVTLILQRQCPAVAGDFGARSTSTGSPSLREFHQ